LFRPQRKKPATVCTRSHRRSAQPEQGADCRVFNFDCEFVFRAKLPACTPLPKAGQKPAAPTRRTLLKQAGRTKPPTSPHSAARKGCRTARTPATRADSALTERLTMSSKIYVGNLPYSVTDDSLQSNFSEFGEVTSAKVMMDRDTGRSKGFAFVETSTPAFAQAAIDGLNGAIRGWPLHRGQPGPSA